MAVEYWEDVPDLDRRRDRAAKALGIDPAGLPSEERVLARLAGLPRGSIAEACLVVAYEGEPLHPLFEDAPSRQPTDWLRDPGLGVCCGFFDLSDGSLVSGEQSR
ncbi:hypothetical protein [Streptomyces yangpuensis]|uniref:hypothetical protein n=1 Tax=Streptomyces yangpuensis TaxID=1648182 RepID=UPI0038212D9A